MPPAAGSDAACTEVGLPARIDGSCVPGMLALGTDGGGLSGVPTCCGAATGPKMSARGDG